MKKPHTVTLTTVQLFEMNIYSDYTHTLNYSLESMLHYNILSNHIHKTSLLFVSPPKPRCLFALCIQSKKKTQFFHLLRSDQQFIT